MIQVKDIQFNPFYHTLTILGSGGCGKSYLTRKFTNQLQNFIVYDVNHEYQNISKAYLCRTIEQVKYAFYLSKNQGCKCIYQPYDIDLETLEELSYYVWQRGNMTLIVEEIGNFMLPYAKTNARMFKRICDVGRHRNIGLITVGRAARDNPPYILRNAHIICSFYTQRKEDIELLDTYTDGMQSQFYREHKTRDFYFVLKDHEKVLIHPPI